MFILMHCGGMPFNGETINNESLGGSESAAYYIARALAKRGHKVTLFTNTDQEGTWDGVRYLACGPTDEQNPLGARFHFYALNTPHDVCMIQRAPGAFTYRFASKLNIVWLHDLALHRNKPHMASAMWNIDAMFTVSEFHKRQVVDVYGLDPSFVMPVTNGVDLDLFKGKIINSLDDVRKDDGKKHADNEFALLYSSRPERGLEHLLRPGGIMDRLAQISPRFHLYVCAYHNVVPQMKDFYAALDYRAQIMPNVTSLGALSKKELADVMRQCQMHVYPTEFEEVSCITAMEAMAAGLPLITSEYAALPETCKNAGAMLIPLKDGVADEDAFVSTISSLGLHNDILSKETYLNMAAAQTQAAEAFSWDRAAIKFEEHFKALFSLKQQNPETVLKHLVHVSDYYAATLYENDHPELVTAAKDTASEELRQCYEFARNNTWKEHYRGYYEYEKQRGVEYGPESLDGNSRFESVSDIISRLPDGSHVLDYGCAHGHYTVNLAKRFPKLNFTGIDLAASNVEAGRKWAERDGVGNVVFFEGEVDTTTATLKLVTQDEAEEQVLPKYSAIIAAEVLEHVEAPWALADVLSSYHLTPTGMMIITTPFGPWEAIGYKEHWPWRAHVHHLERADLHDLFGDHPDFKVSVLPSSVDKFGDVLGSYLTVYRKPKHLSGRIDYRRKFKLLSPRQTLSVCMIVRDSALTLAKCLESVKDIADEIIIAVDKKSKDDTLAIARKYAKGMSPEGELVFEIDSPTDIGFDEARNRTIARAKGDWVLWIDADEILFYPERVRKYLRHNQFTAYAVKQIHYSVEPAGVLRTDLPTRLFRNNKGIKFFGVVHEHPELELNKGIGQVTLLADVYIGHYGYPTEDVRRGRFERNIGLLVRDREKYPDRVLGKFLWLRDLAQMCRWEAESNGGNITPAMRERAQEGIRIWEELLDGGHVRMISEDESLDFYSTLVKVLGTGFDFSFRFNTSKMNGGAHPEQAPQYKGRFASKEHAEKLFLTLLKERTVHYDSKYF